MNTGTTVIKIHKIPTFHYNLWNAQLSRVLTYSLLNPGSSSEVQLLGKDVHWVLVNRLGGLSLPGNSVSRLTDPLHMTIDVDWDIKPQHNNNNSSHY